MANWHYCTWAKDSNTIRALFIDLPSSSSTDPPEALQNIQKPGDVRQQEMFHQQQPKRKLKKKTKKKKRKQWIKTLIWVRGQIRQPAEMRVEHLHCAIMYSKWLHKCFFLSLKKKKKVFKKRYLLLRHR